MSEIGSRFENPNANDCAALHRLLGLPGTLIESPELAPRTLRLDKLWEKTPSDLFVPSEREIFLGFDLDKSSNEIVCSENTLGQEDAFWPKQLDHLMWLHTEPANTRDDLKIQMGPIALHTPTEAELFGQNFPMPYLGDMDTMMKRPSIYASVIIRLPYHNNERAAALVALKTKQFKKNRWPMLWHELKNMALDEKHPVKQVLSEDKIISKECGIAIYRGFISVPPTEDEILRLRKF